jgi:hypothetical protein
LRIAQLKGNQKPSFVYIAPGAWLVPDGFTFNVRHYGPNPVHNIEIVFTDKDHQKAMASDPHVTVDQMTRTLSFAEIDPIEGVWAKQFPWKPLEVDHQHYDVAIASREGFFVEKLRVEHIDEQWQYAMTVVNQRTNRVLIDCQDAKFPSAGGSKKRKCFPDFAVTLDAFCTGDGPIWLFNRIS